MVDADRTLEGVFVLVIALLGASAAVVFPGVQPQLSSVGDDVYLTFGQGHVISVVRSTDGGETFGRPSQLLIAGKLSLGMRRGPRIAATNGAVLVAAVAGEKGGGADGDVLVFRSTDRGATWAAPVVINDVTGAAREGMHAIAASPNGFVVIAWLDLRQKGTRIYTAVSRDHGATWSPDRLVYSSPSGTVCECCHPSVALSGDGRVAIMFRNSLGGHRDMYVARSSDGVTFTPAEKLGSGSWSLDACPMDGGALVFDGENVASTWRREDGIYLSTPGKPEQRIGTGRDPVVAQLGQYRDVAWSSAAGVVLVRNSAAPMRLGDGRFPAVLALDRRTILAWEHQGRVTVRAVPR
jgi:hypothetical protein